MLNKRINIFTGHFGSGKTEVAVNFAVKLAKEFPKVAIVDFDIVNPFFRTVDAKTVLEDKGIKVVASVYANTNVDVPVLPAEINSLFEKRDYKVVFDVGGDDLGARALSRYKEEIEQDDYAMFFVINTRRPMTDTQEKIEEMIYEIESSSRLKVSCLVNNTNLLQSTTAEDILEGHRLIGRTAEKLNLPVAFVSGFDAPLKALEGRLDVELFIMDKLIKLPWD